MYFIGKYIRKILYAELYKVHTTFYDGETKYKNYWHRTSNQALVNGVVNVTGISFMDPDPKNPLHFADSGAEIFSTNPDPGLNIAHLLHLSFLTYPSSPLLSVPTSPTLLTHPSPLVPNPSSLTPFPHPLLPYLSSLPIPKSKENSKFCKNLDKTVLRFCKFIKMFY